MNLGRLYVDQALATGAQLTLSKESSHYLQHVLRAKLNDQLTVFNGRGGCYRAEVIALSKKSVEILVQQFEEQECESPLEIHLAQGIARGEKMDLIVQKAVELGVSAIYPLITERCNVRYADAEREQKRLHHWQQVIISACEQSGRNRLPALHAPQKLADYLSNLPDASDRYVLWPHGGINLKSIQPPTQQVTLLIGPEGGLSEKEIDLAGLKNFQALQLGPRVLRTETAGLAAISAIQTLFGDLG